MARNIRAKQVRAHRLRIMDVLTAQSAKQESAPISLSRRENADDPESSAEAMKARFAGAMKLPRRNFLHLLAGASALPLAPHGERLLRDPTGTLRGGGPYSLDRKLGIEL
jgi:hypothetical protein